MAAESESVLSFALFNGTDHLNAVLRETVEGAIKDRMSSEGRRRAGIVDTTPSLMAFLQAASPMWRS